MTGDKLTLKRAALAAYEAALAAVDPARCVAERLRAVPVRSQRLHLFALGKAADAMVAGAHAALGERIGRCLVIGSASPDGIARLAGAHPVPDQRSLEAADAAERFLRSVDGSEGLLVLISGGGSAMMERPADGVPLGAWWSLVTGCHRLGWDIGRMNRLRSALSDVKAGRLGERARSAETRVLVLSDVPGSAEQVASGPFAGPGGPQPPDEADLTALDGVSPELSRWCRAQRPGSSGRAAPTHEVVADNRAAVEAAAAALGPYGVRADPDWSDGPASELGAGFAERLLTGERFVAGGEARVMLPPDAPPGGRCQHLALAAAGRLVGSRGSSLLVAGTDGVDGDTDCAGAWVDGDTWSKVVDAGRDPSADLASFRAHEALAAAGALIDTGPTGTNVADLIIGLREPS